ncbi:MAG: hypothetical protein GTN40_00065, partial [Candidatus Aenigmarchaeota archaeon]|nr:hypothetical protein [Candidatus Aenigmarchaeota archaeon]
MESDLKRVSCDVISIGDYQPIEAKFKLIQKCLEVVLEYEFPFHGIEKSTLILRDLDLIKKIDKKSWACVSFSIISNKTEVKTGTFELDLRWFEPKASLVETRFEAMRKFAKEGILTGTVLMPCLPYITDSDEILEGIVENTKRVGGKYILFAGLTLNPPFRERYLSVVAEHFPGILSKYEKLYRDADRFGFGPTVGRYFYYLNKKVNTLCEKYGLLNYIPRPIRLGASDQKLRFNKKWARSDKIDINKLSKESLVFNQLLAEKFYLRARELNIRGANYYQILSYQKTAWILDLLTRNIKSVYNKEGISGI